MVDEVAEVVEVVVAVLLLDEVAVLEVDEDDVDVDVVAHSYSRWLSRG